MSQDVPERRTTVIDIDKTRIQYPSAAGDVNINAWRWAPVQQNEDQPPLGIVQIVHGMTEYIDRYDEYARFLASKGYVVVGNDHVGHGESVSHQDDWGHIPADQGDEILVEDVHRLRLLTQGEYGEDIPYFIHGHSMGSFVVRLYIAEYAVGLCGAIIEGTGNVAASISSLGRKLCAISAKIHGPTYHSKFIDNLAMSGYRKSVHPARTQSDWLSRDNSVVDGYIADPMCGFMFDVSAYSTLMSLTYQVVKDELIAKVSKDLSILVVSGECDPVGDMGKGPKAVYEAYNAAGIYDVQLKLYLGARHELHNELCKQEFFDDILAWLDSRDEAWAGQERRAQEGR